MEGGNSPSLPCRWRDKGCSSLKKFNNGVIFFADKKIVSFIFVMPNSGRRRRRRRRRQREITSLEYLHAAESIKSVGSIIITVDWNSVVDWQCYLACINYEIMICARDKVSYAALFPCRRNVISSWPCLGNNCPTSVPPPTVAGCVALGVIQRVAMPSRQPVTHYSYN